MSNRLEDLLGRLSGVRRSGDGYMARCPAHEDAAASLSLTAGRDGRVLVHCFAGCSPEAICDELGLSVRDLFPNDSPTWAESASRRDGHREHGGAGDTQSAERGSNTRTPFPGLTLAEYATARRLPEDFLRAVGVSEVFVGKPALRIRYLDETGVEAAVRFRHDLEGPDRFRWKPGAKPTLYGLWRLSDARERGFVILVEGESDTHSLWFHGFPAVGVPGASTWKPEWASYFDGIDPIYAVIEPDRGGETLEKLLGASSLADRLRLVRLDRFKDVSELRLADPDGFVDAINRALAAATAWVSAVDAERRRAAEHDRAHAQLLLDARDVLSIVADTMHAMGFAGDSWVGELIYVALTSRLLPRPLNVAVVAPSAAGKNRAVDAALALVPDEAKYVVGASSPRALIFSDADFQHRTVVIGEADSIPEDGPAASAIRALAHDDRMTYEIVEKSKSGRFETRRIEKPGPTGLITTSTRSLSTQLGTRLLEVSVPDNDQQTRLVMRSQARAAAGDVPVAPSLEPFHAFQRLLASSGVRRVVVPFADALAELVPANIVRMRRDFPKLLTAIQTIALLHQEHRHRDASGAVVAEIEDYVQAHRLLAPVFDAIVAEGMTPVLRETIEAVPEGEEIGVTDLAGKLGIAKSTASSRVRQAIKGGWLVNLEHRKGHVGRLTRGSPLPEVRTALPDPALVARVFECASGEEEAKSSPPPTTPEFEGEI